GGGAGGAADREGHRALPLSGGRAGVRGDPVAPPQPLRPARVDRGGGGRGGGRAALEPGAQPLSTGRERDRLRRDQLQRERGQRSASPPPLLPVLSVAGAVAPAPVHDALLPTAHARRLRAVQGSLLRDLRRTRLGCLRLV